MNTKKILIWTNILLFLALLLIMFEMKPTRPDFYKDPVLKNLGLSKEKVIRKYGNPDKEGGMSESEYERDFFFYEKENVSFFFDKEAGVVSNIEVYPGTNILGVVVGMTFNEIEKILGDPQEKGYNFHDNNYTLSYFLGEKTEGMGEVEVWFSAEEEDGETEMAKVLWKKYWWEKN